jgi:hypothetical protein
MLTINKHILTAVIGALVTGTIVKFILGGAVVLTPLGVIMTLLFLFLLTQIYIKGHEGKGAVEGVRFGILFGLLAVTYKIAGMTTFTVDATVIHTLIEYLVIGVTFGLLYKKA